MLHPQNLDTLSLSGPKEEGRLTIRNIKLLLTLNIAYETHIGEIKTYESYEFVKEGTPLI